MKKQPINDDQMPRYSIDNYVDGQIVAHGMTSGGDYSHKLDSKLYSIGQQMMDLPSFDIGDIIPRSYQFLNYELRLGYIRRLQPKLYFNFTRTRLIESKNTRMGFRIVRNR